MQIRIFGENTPSMNKSEAINNAIKEFVAFYKANNLRKQDIVAFVPMIEENNFGYIVNIWTLLERI